MADGPASATLILGSMSLGGVFDQPQIPPASDVNQRIEIGRLAIQVNRDDCSCPRIDSVLDLIRVKRVSLRIDIDKDWSSTSLGIASAVGKKRVGRGDDFIAVPNAASQHRKLQCRRA